jgi:ABC-2 type transport system permease protein
VSFGSLVKAGINTVPPALFLLGVGALVLAIFPRAVTATTYGLVAWSFLVELIGSVVNLSHWILDTSLLFHVAPAPATDPHWGSAAVLVSLGVVATLAANVIFSRRDLINA